MMIDRRGQCRKDVLSRWQQRNVIREKLIKPELLQMRHQQQCSEMEQGKQREQDVRMVYAPAREHAGCLLSAIRQPGNHSLVPVPRTSVPNGLIHWNSQTSGPC